MRLRMFVALVFIMMGTIVHAQKVDVDSDSSAPFATYKTYAWTAGTPAPHPLGEDRIHAMVNAHLAAEGLMEVESAPDVFVTTHVITNDRREIVASGFGGGGFGGFGSATVGTYVEGTLVVDLYDASTKKLVWRGVATATASHKAEKNTSKINKALDKMFEKYPPV